jgi:hypothetical protein
MSFIPKGERLNQTIVQTSAGPAGPSPILCCVNHGMFARAFQGEQSLGEDFGVVGCVGYGAFCDAAEEVRRMEWTSASERMEFQLTVW